MDDACACDEGIVFRRFGWVSSKLANDVARNREELTSAAPARAAPEAADDEALLEENVGDDESNVEEDIDDEDDADPDEGEDAEDEEEDDASASWTGSVRTVEAAGGIALPGCCG